MIKIPLKRKILETSLDLFNEFGLPNVSQRKITDKLNISPGNLTYHFKKKDDIVNTLYQEMIDVIDLKLKEVPYSKVNLKYIKEISMVQMSTYYKYRFLILDLIHVHRNYPQIAEHYIKLMDARSELYDRFMKELIAKNVIRKPHFETEYENLFERFQILLRFWISQALMKNASLNYKQVINYAKIILESLYPYLTAKGVEEWRKLEWEV